MEGRVELRTVIFFHVTRARRNIFGLNITLELYMCQIQHTLMELQPQIAWKKRWAFLLGSTKTKTQWGHVTWSRTFLTIYGYGLWRPIASTNPSTSVCFFYHYGWSAEQLDLIFASFTDEMWMSCRSRVWNLTPFNFQQPLKTVVQTSNMSTSDWPTDSYACIH